VLSYPKTQRRIVANSYIRKSFLNRKEQVNEKKKEGRTREREREREREKENKKGLYFR
jgi:hypothetical protein